MTGRGAIVIGAASVIPDVLPKILGIFPQAPVSLEGNCQGIQNGGQWQSHIHLLAALHDRFLERQLLFPKLGSSQRDAFGHYAALVRVFTIQPDLKPLRRTGFRRKRDSIEPGL